MEISERLSFGEIIVGTNEEFILGFTVVQNKDKSLKLKLSFTNHSHNGRIKQVATSGIFLASGSTDEVIRIFNLRSRRELGYILPHNGTITCLQFHESGFLFSGSEDGKIAILKQGKWEMERELKGHKQGITSIAIHPSGKVGLSISKDKKMITWDLIKGKKAFVVGLKKAGDFIAWSPKGLHYLITSTNVLDIYSVENGNIVQSIDFKENIYCFCFITDDVLVIGGEKKNLCLHDMKLKEMMQWEAHENRTKSLISLQSDDNSGLVASASSDGFIKVWNIDLSSLRSAPTLLGQFDTKCRIICMALSVPPAKQSSSSSNNSTSLPTKKRKLKRYMHIHPKKLKSTQQDKNFREKES